MLAITAIAVVAIGLLYVLRRGGRQTGIGAFRRQDASAPHMLFYSDGGGGGSGHGDTRDDFGADSDTGVDSSGADSSGADWSGGGDGGGGGNGGGGNGGGGD